MCMWRLEANRVSNSVTSTLFSDRKLVCLQKFKASLDQASLSQKQNKQAKLKKNILNLKIQAKGTETTPNDGLPLTQDNHQSSLQLLAAKECFEASRDWGRRGSGSQYSTAFTLKTEGKSVGGGNTPWGHFMSDSS